MLAPTPTKIFAPAAGGAFRFLCAALLVGAIWAAGQGGWTFALGGALAGALALRGLALAMTGRGGPATSFLIDFAALAALGFAVSPSVALWAAPQDFTDLLRLSQPAGIVGALLYLFAAVIGLARRGRRTGPAACVALLLLPFMFNLLLALGSPLLDRVAAALAGDGAAPFARILLRGAVLFVVNEAIVHGACLAMGRRPAQGAMLHLTLLLSAFAAAATPPVAALGSAAALAHLYALPRIFGASLAAALAQAGLWAEVYLVTGVMGDILHDAPPVAPRLMTYWRSGAAKGAVYGGVFVALLLAIHAFVAEPLAVSLFLGSSFVGAALAGALLFPLARTILESTDSTPPFVRRLSRAYRGPGNLVGGAVVGAGLLLAFSQNLPSASGWERFLFGFGCGALAYVAALLYGDITDFARGLRARPRPWRPYALGALLGGIVGGAAGWYFDHAQLDVVRAHFIDHVLVNYGAAGRPDNPYIITPFFSKWGMTHMGMVDGGVKLLYLESLSGVIQWIFAAPLFSINLFFLTALLKRDLAPIRLLFSAEGVRGLADNAIVVLRWGLWMAPIIYAFLKVAPDPQWYNQDGLIRTTVATYMNVALPPSQFRDWSLSVFTALLTYDWLRVLIWFDHMGLRVATLVNMSFVGGDMADEGAAHFLGARGRSRAIPEGVRRFGTWAPLLIPFYIPRGGEWDKAWSGAEAAQRAGTPPVVSLLLGYALFALGLCAALAIFILTRPGARTKTAANEPLALGNGLLTLNLWRDGQNFFRVETAARRGPPIDMTRVVDDPILPRGAFLYFSETPDAGAPRLWSLGANPTGRGFGSFAAVSPSKAILSGAQHDLRCEASVEVADGEPVATWRVRLTNLAKAPRKIRLASYRDLVMNEGGVERRDAAYNALHVGTVFAKPLNAIFARNRLLKNQAGDFESKRLSREVAFHAAGAGDGVRLVGYEDLRARFLGLGQRRDPDALTQNMPLRDPEDEGRLYSFEPCAALLLEIELPAEGSVDVVLVDGWAEDEFLAAKKIEKHLGLSLAPEALAATFLRRRALEAPITPAGPRFAFSADGRELRTAPGAPRPFAHVMAGAHGLGAVATHDGDIFAFHRNARANSLTPFRMGEGRNAPPGQAIHVVEKDSGEIFSATLLPLRRPDTKYDSAFGRGYATFTSESPRLALEQTVFVAPDEPVQILLLTVRNRSERAQNYRIAPVLEIILAETPPDALGALEAEIDDSGRAVYFSNPRNDFVRGWAFVSTSLDAEACEISRAKILGRAQDFARPHLALHGHADFLVEDDGRRAAGFAADITVAPGGKAEICVALGAAPTLDGAQALASRAATLDFAHEKFAQLQGFWDKTLAGLRIETNRPDFDRLVNDWLPYQLLTARLWGRTGPSQRSGAYGYRDQLQDVLPLIALAPELARKQILLHARQQFVEGDVLKWWHEAPSGGVGIGERTHASDPHLWLPYVATRYVGATGDAAILDEVLPFIEGDAVPSGVEGHVISPLPSRESATLFDHCRRAIDYTLKRFGVNGLPLMGAGDWDDGMNLVGFKGRGESVWVGFFLYDILERFIPLQGERDAGRADDYRARALNLQAALDACWRGDRFVRAFADDGSEFVPLGAMSSAWPSLSGAVRSERGRKALENGLAALDKGDRVLLVTPPYDENSKPFPGRSADYPLGVRENGGQYTHGSSWFVDALVKLAEKATQEGDEAQAAGDFARAFQVWESLSPLTKTTPEKIDLYGLPPHQQSADVYDGPGYAGRGGWSWYTGAAARMISAAHALLGIGMEAGELKLRPDAFANKGGLQLKRVTFKGKVFEGQKVKELAGK